MFKYSLNLMLVFLSVACGNKKDSSRTIVEECAIKNYQIWQLGSDTPTVTIKENVWYRDSIGITQVCSIYTSDSGGVKKTKVLTNGYRFFDMRNKLIYEYHHFADTANIVRKFLYSDTTVLVGGWDFFKNYSMPLDTLTKLPDTLMASIPHQKYRVVHTSNGTQIVSIALFRCDIPFTIFKIDKGLSEKVGCPMVSVQMIPSGTNDIGVINQVKIISRNFPDSVRKIFGAWIENEKRYPVK